MSKRDNPIKQWNAVTYLQDFINTCLPLTYEEERIYKMPKEKVKSIEQYVESADQTDWHLNRELREQGYVLCKGCGEIKPQSEFYGEMRYCKECYNKRRKLKKCKR
jgi:hypothetical protein